MICCEPHFGLCCFFFNPSSTQQKKESDLNGQSHSSIGAGNYWITPSQGSVVIQDGERHQQNQPQAAPGFISLHCLKQAWAVVWKQKTRPEIRSGWFCCGNYWIRTSDPLLVRQVLWTSWAKLPFARANIEVCIESAKRNLIFVYWLSV